MNFGVQPCSLFTFAHLDIRKVFYPLNNFRVQWNREWTHTHKQTNSLVIWFSSHGCIKLTKCRFNFHFMGCITQMVVTLFLYAYTILKFNRNTFRLLFAFCVWHLPQCQKFIILNWNLLPVCQSKSLNFMQLLLINLNHRLIEE